MWGWGGLKGGDYAAGVCLNNRDKNRDHLWRIQLQMTPLPGGSGSVIIPMWG